MLSRSVEETTTSLAAFSRTDARRYPEFTSVVGRVAAFVAEAMASTPPNIERLEHSDLWPMLQMGRRLRGLGKKDAYRLLRWAPMPVADFVSEWFESEPLRAAIAAPALIGTTLGPRSAGSTAVWLMKRSLGDVCFVRGGLGALSAALASAAAAAGVEVRVNAGVRTIDVRDGRVSGVTLESGEELRARAVVSNADPRQTFLSLVDPVHLEPGFLTRLRNYRCHGHVAKINLALNGLPQFKAANGTAEYCRERFTSPPISTTSSVRTMRRSMDPARRGRSSTSRFHR